MRARPGFPNHTFEDPDECPNCLGAGFVFPGNGIPAWQQKEMACKRCTGQQVQASMARQSGLPDTVKGYSHFDPNLVENGHKALMATMGFGREEVAEFFLTLAGNNGTGKTHLLMAMAKEVLDAGFVVRYLYAPLFLEELKRTFDRKPGDSAQSYDAVFEGYKSPYLLVVDDLARGHHSEWGVSQMELLIEHRYRREMKTAFGTNYDATEMAEKLGLMVVDRVFDFGSGAALVAHLGGPSYRTKREW